MWLDFGSFGETADTVFLVNASCCSTLIGSAERPVLWHQMQETVREDGIGLNKAWSWWWSRRRIKYLLTPYRRVLLSKLIGSKLVKKFPAFYRTRRFITIFTSARHLSLSWASSIQSIPPHPTSWRSILISSSHLRLGLPNGLFPSGFPTKTLYTPLLSPIHATCPAHLILLHFIAGTIFGEEYRSLSSSLCSFLHFPVTSSLLGPNILLSTLFSNTLSLRSSLNVSDQVSHPYTTTGKVIILYMTSNQILTTHMQYVASVEQLPTELL